MFIRFFLMIVVLLHGAVGFCAVRSSAALNCADSAELAPIGMNTYVRFGQHGTVFVNAELANLGVVVGEKSVAIIDTGGSFSEGQALLCAVREITQLPIGYVINTHVHPDHVLGNMAFAHTGAKFVGHKNLPKSLALLGPTYLHRAKSHGDIDTFEMNLNKVDIQVRDTLELDLGGRHLLLRALPQAHTANDLLISDSLTDTWWLGDILFSEHIPVLGGSGSVNGWLAVLDALKSENPKHVIAGHGRLAHHWRDVVARQVRYLTSMRAQVRDWIADDRGLAAAVEQIGQPLENQWPMFVYFHKRNISYMYSELEWE